MEKINFSVNISATKEKVWNTLWDDATYRQWTSVFSPSSYAVTDNWRAGTKVLFLDSGGSGMVSEVVENRQYDYMSFKHLGEVKNGVEDTTSDKVKEWNGVTENYTLTETGGNTNVLVEIEGRITKEFKDFFANTFPKALDKLKMLAEN